MLTTILLGDGRPPFRLIWEGELPAVPSSGEPFSLGGRTYKVLERSWRMGTPPGEPEAPMIVAVALLVSQISGPPHVVLANANLDS